MLPKRNRKTCTLHNSNLSLFATSDEPYVVVDCETTGLNNLIDGLVEIAAIRFQRGRIIGRFETLVNPVTPIPPTASAIHFLTDRHVADAPSVVDALDSLKAFVGDSVVVAHNADFDRGFLHTIAGNRWVCSMRLARHIWPEAPSYKNHVLRFWLGIAHPNLEGTGAHRAFGDAFVTGLVFQRALETFSLMAPDSTLADVADFVASALAVKRFDYGRKHRGEAIKNVPTDYLRWVIADSAEPADRRRLSVDDDTLAAVKGEMLERAA